MTTIAVESRITDGNVISQNLREIWDRLGGAATGEGNDLEATMRAIRLASMSTVDPHEVTLEQLTRSHPIN
ncbi:MAG TPA: hypothetical protein VLG37_02225 [Candidatus Saccharimonadales bacterium]|nr:hypothetical protein [Candidatus Saccharimonadales bacterium]